MSTQRPLAEERHPAPTVPYAGIATRAVALTIDAAVVTASFWLTTAVFALVLSLFSSVNIEGAAAALGALGSWGVFVTAYFVLSWMGGKTFGMHLMQLRVVTGDGDSPSFCRSAARMWGFVIGAIPFFAGFLMVLVSPRRRAFHDLVARTFVVYADREPEPELDGAGATPATGGSAAPTNPATL